MMDASNALAIAIPGFVCSGAAMIFIIFLYTKIWSYKIGKDIDEPMIDELSAQIKSGSVKFLQTEYTFLTIFVFGLAGTLFSLFAVTSDDGMKTATAISLAFMFGAVLSASAGWWGMMVATDGNAKTTVACAGHPKMNEKGTLNAGLKVAFTTGAVMGFAVVGMGLAGVSLTFVVLCNQFGFDNRDIIMQ